MKKFDDIKSKYLLLGVSANNIDYAIESVMDGSKREIIMETLTADYRGMNALKAAALLDDLFLANGGEFKKENRGGYLFGTLLTLVGVAGFVFFVVMIISGEIKPKFLSIAFAFTIFGLVKGPILLIKAFRGNYRDSDDPFNE